MAAIVAWNPAGNRIVATDVRNYIDLPGSFLAGAVNHVWHDQPNDDDPSATWERVAVDRAVCVYRAITEIIDWWISNGMGTFGLTTGACSLAAFRNMKNGCVIETPDDEECRDFERSAYYGGITECLWVGAKHGNRYTPHPKCLAAPDLFHGAPTGCFHLVDASSFYGYIHSICPVPVRLTHVGNGMTPDEAKRIAPHESALTAVQLDSRVERFATRHNDRVVYPTGRYATTLAGPEFAFAVASGVVVGVGRWHHYVCQPAMELFSQTLYAARQREISANHIVAGTFIKGLIASLHGKFAQRKLKWQVCPNEPCLEEWGTWRHYSKSLGRTITYRAIGTQVQMECDSGDSPHTFPAIAAFTTACGRMTLRMWERIAGVHNVLYLNTDAMIVTDKGLDNLKWAGLLDDAVLGGLKVKASSPDIEIRGQGCFSFGGKLWMSGINRSESQLIFGTVHHQTHSGLAGVIVNKGIPAIKITTHELSPGWYYDPMRTDDNGWITPMHINESGAQWISDLNQDDALQE